MLVPVEALQMGGKDGLENIRKKGKKRSSGMEGERQLANTNKVFYHKAEGMVKQIKNTVIQTLSNRNSLTKKTSTYSDEGRQAQSGFKK